MPSVASTPRPSRPAYLATVPPREILPIVDVVAKMEANGVFQRGADDERLDLVIIGGGPAGLSAAVEAEKRGLKYVLIERNKVVSTIRGFPPGKKVYAEPHFIQNASELDVDEDLASVLVNEGYSSLELIAGAKESDLSKIEGFEKEISKALINRSKEALLTLTMEISSENEGEDNDLMAVSLVDMSLAIELNQKGIKTRDDLAELSVEELTDIIEIEEKAAGELIMEAREHWFKEDK